MKNKEIEELLNELQKRKERYDYCKNNDISFSDEDYKSYLLLSYIEQLRKKIDQYENPDDLTLFYMWLDEKAKDKMKQLETNYKEANESVIWWQNRYNAIVKQNDDNHKKVVKLENNRDKAIEFIDNYLEREYFNYDILETNTIYNRDLFKVKNILKGDSE